jgi:hypothetical protein
MKTNFKNILLATVAFLYLGNIVIAQVPQAFSFQGIAVDEQDNPISEKGIKIQIGLLQGSPTGMVQYQETHQVTTLKNGLYSLSVGQGMTMTGVFSEIDWSNIPIYISVGIDINGGNNYVLAGISQLLSVPYALEAGNVHIKPKIYVKLAPLGGTARVFNKQDYNGLGGIKYIYEWVQGTPEDVYVEYVGLPDNVNIFTNTVGGFSLDTDEISTTKVEIIEDGILKRQSFLGVANKNINVPVKKYQLTLIFKTKNEDVLATLPYTLSVE